MERKDVKNEQPEEVRENHRKYKAEYRKANSERIKEKQRERYQKHKKVNKIAKYKKYLEEQ